MITDFNISFNTHLQNLLQWFDAYEVRMAWLRVLITPIKYVHGLFIPYRTEVNRRATYTGQVMVLERMLNLQYYNEDVWASPSDPTAGGHIYIERLAGLIPFQYTFYDSESQEPLYTFYDGETNLDQVYTYYESEYQAQVAFNVRVPASLTFNEEEMRARIDKYLIAGVNYEIITY